MFSVSISWETHKAGFPECSWFLLFFHSLTFFFFPFQEKLLAIFSPSLALALMLGGSNIIRWDFYRPSKANKIINVAVQIIAIIAGQAKKKKKSFGLKLTNLNVIRVWKCNTVFLIFSFFKLFFPLYYTGIFSFFSTVTDFSNLNFQCIDSAY